MSLSRRLGALAFAALLTPFSALALDDGSGDAAPAGSGALRAKPRAAAVKSTVKKKKPLAKSAARKRAPAKKKEQAVETLPDPRAKRGERLLEKGEALGGGADQREAAATEKKEASADRLKREGD